MDAPGLNASRRPADCLTSAPREHAVDLGWHGGEAACLDTEQTGLRAPGADGQRTGEISHEGQGLTCLTAPLPPRAHLIKCFRWLKLSNDTNVCFVNTAVQAMLWATLCLPEFDIEVWGTFAMQLATFLSDAAPDVVLDLMDIPFFHDLMQNWNNYGRQGDSIEF